MDEDNLDQIDSAIQSKLAGGDDNNDSVVDNEAELEAAELAGKKGWVPKDKYKGDPAKWKPASQFLADGEKFNKNLQSRLERLEQENEQLKKSGKAFAEYHEQQMQAKQAEIDTAIKQLRVQKSQATADGEHNLAVEIEDRIELLREEKAGLKKEAAKEEKTSLRPPEENLNSPVVKEWVEDGNEWFNERPDLQQYAFEYANELVNKTTVRGRKFLDMVAEHMREEFPRQFAKIDGKKTTERRNDQTESAAGGAGNGKSGSYSIHDLPAEELQLMREFVKNGWTTQEKYLANYFSADRRAHVTKQGK